MQAAFILLPENYATSNSWKTSFPYATCHKDSPKNLPQFISQRPSSHQCNATNWFLLFFPHSQSKPCVDVFCPSGTGMSSFQSRKISNCSVTDNFSLKRRKTCSTPTMGIMWLWAMLWESLFWNLGINGLFN